MKPENRRRVDGILGVVGRTFITAGLLLLGLVVYQLWGTGFEQRRAQDRLRDDFAAMIDDARPNPGTVTTEPEDEPTTSTAKPVDVPRRPNSALALLEIPSASVADIVVAGASVSALRHGPGHITGTALPGEPGNSAIAGHRSTYGAPFADLDDVRVGDEIRVTTAKGIFSYTVGEVEIVAPNRTDVLLPKEGKSLLTLVTCHPRFSTSKRLIVTAELTSSEPLADPGDGTDTTTSAPPATVSPPSTPAPEVTPDTTPAGSEETSGETTVPDLSEIDGWFSDSGAILPSILLGLVLAAIAVATHFVRRWLRSRGRGSTASRLIAWGAAAVPFVVVLFYWYHFINMLLPASA